LNVLFINLLVYLARNDLHRAGIQHILDSVMLALEENPDRRFIYVEIAYFWRWWNEQTEEIRDKVTGFVNDGKIYHIIFDVLIRVTI
jgi:lysosomal alpha-mannosidase